MVTNDIEALLKAIPGEKIKFALTDIDGILRGKMLHLSKFRKGLVEGLGFCNVIFGWDMQDVCYDNSVVSGWHTGFPDAICHIDPSTLRRIPWDSDVPFFLADFSRSESAIQPTCPRTLLKTIRQQCIDLGYEPIFAKEFEWFNFQESPQSLQEKGYLNPTPISPGMFGYSLLRPSLHQDFFNALFDNMLQFGIPIEGLHTETGPGVYEAALVYCDVLEAADRAVLFKSGVKELAYRFGMIASFMAKWNEQLPGCGGHIHQSLWDKNRERNLFFDPKKEHRMSELMEHYLAGQLHCLPYIMPMFAPTVNSYKRLVKGSWAAVTASWGIENRTAALRVINHNEGGMRLETRIPGADANPYLSIAASLAAGLYGIKNKLTLTTAPTLGSEYDNPNNPRLPKTLDEAVQAMKHSDLPKALFGEGFVDHFIKTREWEWQQFTQQVTQWELKRYFELI
jgi:glutamine synthetase